MLSEDPNTVMAAMTLKRSLWQRAAARAGGGSVKGEAGGLVEVEEKRTPWGDTLGGVEGDVGRLEEV